jgi:uncharacterized RDD family membrane protein YckC
VSKLEEYVSDGAFWMKFWLAVLAVVLLWGIGTILWWSNSIVNLNLLSIFALVLACAGAFQASLGMRKADPKDNF